MYFDIQGLPKAQPKGRKKKKEKSMHKRYNSDFSWLQGQLPQGFFKMQYENKTMTTISAMALKLSFQQNKQFPNCCQCIFNINGSKWTV